VTLIFVYTLQDCFGDNRKNYNVTIIACFGLFRDWILFHFFNALSLVFDTLCKRDTKKTGKTGTNSRIIPFSFTGPIVAVSNPS